MKLNGKVRFAIMIFAILALVIYFFIENKKNYDEKVNMQNTSMNSNIDVEKL